MFEVAHGVFTMSSTKSWDLVNFEELGMLVYLNPYLCEKVYPLYVLLVGVWQG